MEHLPRRQASREIWHSATLQVLSYHSKIPKIPKTPIDVNTKFAKMKEDD
jgi:hypothetical protein